jgi:pSer/pThr/pTyr-binding forkhead associated (FHA) protein
MRLTVYFPEDSPTTHEFVGQKLTIGRLGDNDVKVEDASVSSHHGEIELGEGSAVLRDLDSTNGTFLNGEQITGEHPLAEGDEIYFGSIRTVFMESVLPPAVTAPPALEEGDESAREASGGGRPANFRHMSPLPRAKRSRDTLGGAAWVSAVVGLLAAGYALFVIFSN